MKRLRDAPSSSSALEQTKVLLNDTIKSLTALEADGGHSNQHVEIQRTKKPRELDFLYRIHRWLTGGKGKIQTNDNEGQGKGCSIGNHDDRFKRLEKQVEELKQQIGKFDHRIVLNNCEKTLLPFPETKLVGKKFEQNIEKIMGWLKNSQIFKIGVHGMGGVGKTALLKQVYNGLLQDTSTSQPYWATVSHCDSVYKLQGSIAQCFGLDFTDEDDVMKRASILHSTLAKREGIVLILDDMWQPLFPDEVGIPLGENGCKIILTTRSLEVCRRMGCKDFVIKVEILAEDEAAALFMDNLEEDYDKLATEVEIVVELVLWKCYGLPLAIVTMARRMRGVVEINEWQSVLDELRSFKQMDMNDEVYTRLQNSYDSLKDEIIKKCFLSSMVHLFIGNSVSRNCLAGHWIDEGLLDEIESSEQRSRKALTIINKLVDSCLLEDRDYGALSCHKLTQAMALCMAGKTRSPLMLKSYLAIAKLPKDELWSEDLVTVSLTGNLIKKISFDMSPKCPKLTVLNLDNNPLMEVPEPFFMHMTALTVLNLSYTNIKILPNSVSKLKSLRVLKLAYCNKLARAPSLATLMKLKVLDLWGASNVEGHMGLENLKLLEKLYFTWMSDWMHFNRLMESWPFSCLHTYRFSYHKGFPNLVTSRKIDEAYDTAMEIISVDLHSEKLVVPCDIEELKLRQCVMTSLGDGLPPGSTIKLKRIELDGCKGMEYMVSATTQVHFIFLQALLLESMFDLRGIIKLEGREIPQPTKVFSRLSDLSIIYCKKFKNFLLLNSVQQRLVWFSNLERLTLGSCEEFEDFQFISVVEDASPGKIGSLVVPNLRVLKLLSLPKLSGTLCKGQLYSTLRELTISGCHEVKEVFRFDPSQHSQSGVPNLERVWVLDCENLEMIFSSSNNSRNLILVFPKLKSLELINLPKLGSIYRGVLLCTCIEKIYIWWCTNYQQVKELSKPVICDRSPSTLACLPRYDANKDWWEPLRDFPEDMRRLSDLADKCRGSQQCEGPNPSALNTHQISTESELAFALANVGMGQNFTQDFSNVGHPETGQNAVPYTVEWMVTGIGMPEDENANQTSNNPIVTASAELLYDGQWLPYDPPHNEGSSSGYVWGGQH